MNTIDSILPVICQHMMSIKDKISRKDKRILLSFNAQLQKNIFLTKNQSILLVKILNKNIEVIKTLDSSIEQVILSNLWSKQFRSIEQVRKIYICSEDISSFIVEFNSNPIFKEKIVKILPLINGPITNSGTKYTFLFNERNVDLIITLFLKENFKIDEKLLKFYEKIQKVKNSNVDPNDIFLTNNKILKNAITNDLISISPENLLILHDRKIRYQYNVNNDINDNSLTAKIATRKTQYIHLDTKEIVFSDIIESLINLDRFPVMIIFQGKNSKNDKIILDLIADAVNKFNLNKDIGIYFRYNQKENNYDQKELNAEFNKTIERLQYNKNLSKSTIIAGVDNYKLPKIFIKENWKPSSVISFTNNFRFNKINTYCKDVDLIIYYTSVQPLEIISRKNYGLMQTCN